MSNLGSFYVHLPTGHKYGPATEAELIEWARQGRIPAHASIVNQDGAPGIVAWQHPLIAGILAAPPTVQGPVVASSAGSDATGGIIPYKNPSALIGYYTSIASLLPFIGAIIGIVAVILGVLGLQAVKKNPQVRGTAHAWVAIILGSLTTVGYIALIVVLAVR